MSAIQPPKTFGPQWYREGRKWGDRSTPCRLYPTSEVSEGLEFEGIPRRPDYSSLAPEPTWQEMFHNLHDLLTGGEEENRAEVSFDQMGSLIAALSPPRPRPEPIEYKEPGLSEYELLRQTDLEEDKQALATLRETNHENRNTLKALMEKQTEISNSLQAKEDEWAAEQERQKKVYRPKYLAALAPSKRPAFLEDKKLESLMEQLTEIRRAMSDYQVKVTRLKLRIENGETFMKQAFENLEILREYRKFEHTLVGDYI
jgi:hypothetical protein